MAQLEADRVLLDRTLFFQQLRQMVVAAVHLTQLEKMVVQAAVVQQVAQEL